MGRARVRNWTFMSKLDAASERFKASLDRLEAGLHRQILRAQSAGRLESEVNALKEDRSKLAEDLDQLKSEARRINELNERASETIANTIEGIREVLAE
ncbi:MAG: DUF4164 family protein [Parvibaculaceae bacterium]